MNGPLPYDPIELPIGWVLFPDKDLAWQTEDALQALVDRHLRAAVALQDSQTSHARLDHAFEARRRSGPGHSDIAGMRAAQCRASIAQEAFVFAVENCQKILTALAKKIPSTVDLTPALAIINNAFPDLNGVRDSLHHPDDRIFSQDRKGKRIVPGPIIGRSINAPSGGVFVVGPTTTDAGVSATDKDGNLASVAMDEVALGQLRAAVCQAVAAMPWGRRTRPVRPAPL